MAERDWMEIGDTGLVPVEDGRFYDMTTKEYIDADDDEDDEEEDTTTESDQDR